MVTELFFDKTKVFKKDEFVTIYDIFMGSVPKKDKYPIDMKSQKAMKANKVKDEIIKNVLE